MFWDSFIRNIRILLLTKFKWFLPPISLKISSLHMIWKPLNQFCCSLLSNKRFETLFIIRNIRISLLTKFKWFLPPISLKILSWHTVSSICFDNTLKKMQLLQTVTMSLLVLSCPKLWYMIWVELRNICF